jgi:hypothetical protein
LARTPAPSVRLVRVRLRPVSYDTLIQRWHDFYIVAGTASATLVGLMFVGLSLHLRVVVSNSEVRSLARVTLANFGLLLFVSLFLVIPEGSSAAGTELVVSGLVSLGVIAPSLVAAIRTETRTLRPMRILLRIASSALAYVGVIVAGILLRGGSAQTAMTWLVVVVVLVLFTSLRNSWDLLVSVGEATMGERSISSSDPV